ncbi:MAG: cob(I)yrinic acid a,c-diamide adenosyltransferase, partial [Lentisphaerae bacterium]|nr:cob(I)yrinic acid a,c-diamide adenosyltransferase [Lentisphaerota bacterium]
QFLKGRPCSEVAGLARFGEAVTVRTYGRGVFIRGAPAAEDVRAAQAGLDAAEAALAGGAYDLVILDEAVTAARLGLFPAERLTALIDRKPEAVELVLTGRGAGAALLEKADLVTDMRAVKHYFDAGVTARPGIEY